MKISVVVNIGTGSELPIKCGQLGPLVIKLVLLVKYLVSHDHAMQFVTIKNGTNLFQKQEKPRMVAIDMDKEQERNYSLFTFTSRQSVFVS